MIITDTGTRIDITLLDYSKRRNTVCKECYLVLLPEFIQYKVVADYECRDDDSDIWKEFRGNNRWTRKRSSISSVEMYLDNAESLWSVDLEFEGVANANSWCFEDPKKALAVYTQLMEYMLM